VEGGETGVRMNTSGVKRLDARFRGHDGAESTDFMRKLPGPIPERRPRMALRECLRESFAEAFTFSVTDSFSR
jgi:hypothetical protein